MIDERLVSSLLSVMRGLQAPLGAHVTAEGLTVTQFAVLEMLLHKGEQTINQIIEGVFSTSGNISVVINNLIEAGLLEKRSNPADGRSRLIALTPSGARKIEEYYPRHREEIQRILSGVSAEEKRQLIKTLLLMRSSIDKNIQNKE
ncbi:MarR family winged helix-turn-helix transcriptional regulator [Sphingorhabdus sp. SMR4y]|uniref:MarR family winged helix-turn-helix transcriptional regulator n=1 Tax=Sphingorhabdus sp. SMR4y TaxID=2584094 RepID=UPI001641BBBD|nr:MarR family transcriptional regulator [Sphingorhabdus sp. SMR4y]